VLILCGAQSFRNKELHYFSNLLKMKDALASSCTHILSRENIVLTTGATDWSAGFCFPVQTHGRIFLVTHVSGSEDHPTSCAYGYWEQSYQTERLVTGIITPSWRGLKQRDNFTYFWNYVFTLNGPG